MTLYYVSNACSLGKNRTTHDKDLESLRKALYTELFFLFFLYFLTQIFQTFRQQQTNSNNEQDIQNMSTQNKQNNNQDTKKDNDKITSKALPWNAKKWSNTFPRIFSIHTLAIGMALLFSPFAGTIICAYLHILGFVLFMFGQFTQRLLVTRIAQIIMDLMNLIIIIIALAGINYANTKSNGSCHSSDL